MESLQPLAFDDVVARFPPPIDNTDALADIAGRKDKLPVLVVLDDDPTGTQTCHDINVLTVWDHETLVAEFKTGCPGFFVLTNSRALPTSEARELVRGICQAVKEAAASARKTIEVVLRGDSTLRGHFPDEPEVAEEVLGEADAWVLAPFFEQGGRLTIDDVHYVKSPDGQLVPAAQTPFAKDATFGYKNSNLREYVVEKSAGRIEPSRIYSVSINDVRTGGVNKVYEILDGLPSRSVVIVNAITTADMEVFVQGLLKAEEHGKKYVYRTGAAFVSTRLGIAQIPPLALSDFGTEARASAGGLVIAGSYVPKTTAQLHNLIQARDSRLETITLDVKKLIRNADAASNAIAQAVSQANECISNGRDVLIMTSRELITGDDGITSLKIGSVVAEALVSFLEQLDSRPRYVIAKGGITSSDAATKGLRMKRAQICGQAASGVPIWQCNEETSKWSGIPYVVFPGNVGDDDTLAKLVARWASSKA